jgi:endonuclease/exonuclease/phosphatase family metal-dependent hydrolase
VQVTGFRELRGPRYTTPRVRAFIREGRGWAESVGDGAYHRTFAYAPEGAPELLVVAAHLPSKASADEHGQARSARELSGAICDAEASRGHTRTVLIGDLNMDPFDVGLAARDGLRAVMTRQLAAAGSARGPLAFYNPMWSLFGDKTPGPAGTYYYHEKGHTRALYWHMLDQVLLRPSLAGALAQGTPRVLDRAGPDSLLSEDGRPDVEYSDHLPIVVSLDW